MHVTEYRDQNNKNKCHEANKKQIGNNTSAEGYGYNETIWDYWVPLIIHNYVITKE